MIAVLEQEARKVGSTARLSWQLDSNCFPMTIQKPITLQEAKSIARHLGLTLRQLRSGNYRVNFRDGNETTAYYTDNLEDAVNTAVAMARKRAFSSDCQADRTRAGRARLVMTAAHSSGSDEQMFGAKQQVPHGLRSDQEA